MPGGLPLLRFTPVTPSYAKPLTRFTSSPPNSHPDCDHHESVVYHGIQEKNVSGGRLHEGFTTCRHRALCGFGCPGLRPGLARPQDAADPACADVPAAAWRWPNFSPAEIACRGTGKLLVNESALDALQALRDHLGKPLIVRSTYRSTEHTAPWAAQSGRNTLMVRPSSSPSLKPCPSYPETASIRRSCRRRSRAAPPRHHRRRSAATPRARRRRRLSGRMESCRATSRPRGWRRRL